MTLKQEIHRKIFHLFLILIPLAFLSFGKEKFLIFFTPLAFVVVLVDFARCRFDFIEKILLPIFKKIMRNHEIEEKKLSGASWVFLSAWINFAFFNPIIAVIGFNILIFADSAAAIIGKSFKSKPFYEKSQAGSLAFFLVSLLIILICGIYFDCRLIFFFFAGFIALFITYLEAYPSLHNIDDNFIIPLTFSFSMSLLNFMWHIL